MLLNLQTNTTPIVVHAQGQEVYSPHWPSIRDSFFSSTARNFGPVENLTILTWNNQPTYKGLLEKSLDHLGVPYVVLGRGLPNWVNSRDKPQLTSNALQTVDTEFVMGVDSWDAVIIDNPSKLVKSFVDHQSSKLVFNAGKVNWPNLQEFRDFERSIPAAKNSEFRYLNGGAWIGKTEFCKEFFASAVRTEPLAEQPDAEQGILKRLFQDFYPEVQLDYQCRMFQTLQFVFKPIFRHC